MGKSRRGEKEHSREQRLIHENKKLKKQISSLRKQLARIDLDRYSHVKDIVDEHYEAEEESSTQELLEKLQSEWPCFECGKGQLKPITYSKNGELWYFRKCDSCPHRTKSQPYTPGAKGIVPPQKG